MVVAACSKAPAAAPAGPASSQRPAASGPASAAAPSTPGAVRYYTCTKLLSGQEVRQATGLADARFSQEEKNGPVKGQTYCAFSGSGGSDSIAVSVFTGPSYAQVFQALMGASQNVSTISGVGDSAKWSDHGTTLGVQAGSTGVTIAFTNIGSGSLGISDPRGAAIAMAKLVLSRL
jgi:hypothetical protein